MQTMTMGQCLVSNSSKNGSKKVPFYKTTLARVVMSLILMAVLTSMSLAGSDDGALGDLWSEFSLALTGAPGKILSAAMLLSAGYFSVVKPNPGLAVVSFVMMMILANGEKIISTFLDAGIPL